MSIAYGCNGRPDDTITFVSFFFHNTISLCYTVWLKKKEFILYSRYTSVSISSPWATLSTSTQTHPTLIHSTSGIDARLRSALVAGALSTALTTRASRKATALAATWALASGERGSAGLQLRQPARRGELQAPAVRRHDVGGASYGSREHSFWRPDARRGELRAPTTRRGWGKLRF
jgi:hypothetical protein